MIHTYHQGKMPFPVIKLVSLFLKQLSKPLSNSLKRTAKQHGFFRTLCMKPAQWHHHYEVRWKNELLGFGSTTKPRVPLSEDKAVELGAEMIGEIFLYSFGVAMLAGEYWYSARQADKKEDGRKTQIADMENKINQLLLDTDTMSAQMREMSRLMYSVDETNVKLQKRLEQIDNPKKRSWW